APERSGGGVEVPLAGDPVERVHAAIAELEPGAGDEILDGAGDEHLARARLRRDAGARVHGDAGHLAVDDLALAGMQPESQLEVAPLDRLANRAGTADRARRSVERDEEAVAGCVDLAAAGALELASHDAAVLLEQIAPAAVAE